MRIFVFLLSGSMVFSGCSLLPSAPKQNRKASANGKAGGSGVELANFNPGRVASVDPAGRFSVVTFPFGVVPGPGQKLEVYRGGKKVAEIKITGPQRDANTVADIVSGEVQVNDEVRAD